MSSHVFGALANQTVDTFVSRFSALSKELFYDPKNQQFRHPGEFGAFREQICSEFLRLFIPTYLDVGNGFLINSDDDVSTQCDLVIFDRQFTPKITDAQKFRFFPIETVVCIGEVKSKLGKKDFLDALIKLARNKAMCRVRHKVIARRSASIDAEAIGHHFDATASFLICEKLDFSLQDITANLSLHYDKNGVPIEDRHNLVLSINDGILCYSNHLLARNVAWMRPVTQGERMKNRLVFPGDGERNHFGIFTAYIFSICANATVYLPNMGEYGSRPSVGDYQDEM